MRGYTQTGGGSALVVCTSLVFLFPVTAAPGTIKLLQIPTRGAMHIKSNGQSPLNNLTFKKDMHNDLNIPSSIFKRGRWSLLQTRTLRMRTMGRLQFPCAGVLPGHGVDRLPSLPKLSPDPSRVHLLTSLGQEALAARETIRKLCTLYPELNLSDVSPTHFHLVDFRLPEVLTEATKVPDVLSATYREVARAVLVLELLIGQQTSPALTNGMEALKEVRLFNILCGMKLMLPVQGGGLTAQEASSIQNVQFEVIPNTAFRYARDLHQMSRMAAMLSQTALLLTTLSDQLR